MVKPGLVWFHDKGQKGPTDPRTGKVGGGGGRKKGRKMGLDKESSGNELRGKFNLLNVVV